MKDSPTTEAFCEAMMRQRAAMLRIAADPAYDEAMLREYLAGAATSILLWMPSKYLTETRND